MKFVTSRQLADSLGVSESSVKRWVDDGAINAARTAGGHRRIPVTAAIKFIRQHGLEVSNPRSLALETVPQIGGVDEESARKLFDAMLHDRATDSRAIIAGRFLGGARIASIGDGLIRPALRDLGELWVQRPDGLLLEHRAVDTCVHALAEIGTWLDAAPESAPLAVTAGGPNDPYLLPPMLASLVLREAGLRTVNLGPCTPLETVGLAVPRYGARLCAISFSTPPGPRIDAAWRILKKSVDAVNGRIVVGGRRSAALPASIRVGARECASMAELADYATGWIEGAQGTRSRLEKSA